MLNKYFWQVPANTMAESLDRMTKAIKDFSSAQTSNSQAEIKSKDRVDIPLSEYIQMRKEIEKLDEQVRKMSHLIMQLGIPYEVIHDIKNDSIQVYHNDDVRDFTRHYVVKFDVDASPDIRKWNYDF